MLAAVVPLIALQATLIAVKGTDTVCPTSRQVSQAIEVRLPGLLIPTEQRDLADVLVLTVSADVATGAQSFTLVDRQNQVRLRRQLPLPAVAGADDCPALAETIALMVERYLQDLGYRPEPPASPVGRRWDLFVGTAWRPGATGLSAYELRLGAARALGARGRFALSLVAGFEGASQQEWPGASGRLRRFPAELRLSWRLGIGTTWLETGPFAGVQLLVLDSRAGDQVATDARVIPVAGLGAGLRIPLGRTAFIRVVAAVGVALLRYDFVTRQPGQDVAFGTERLWGKMGLEAGFSFW
jgi:hypothetical protein